MEGFKTSLVCQEHPHLIGTHGKQEVCAPVIVPLTNVGASSFGTNWRKLQLEDTLSLHIDVTLQVSPEGDENKHMRIWSTLSFQPNHWSVWIISWLSIHESLYWTFMGHRCHLTWYWGGGITVRRRGPKLSMHYPGNCASHRRGKWRMPQARYYLLSSTPSRRKDGHLQSGFPCTTAHKRSVEQSLVLKVLASGEEGAWYLSKSMLWEISTRQSCMSASRERYGLYYWTSFHAIPRESAADHMYSKWPNFLKGRTKKLAHVILISSGFERPPVVFPRYPRNCVRSGLEH